MAGEKKNVASQFFPSVSLSIRPSVCLSVNLSFNLSFYDVTMKWRKRSWSGWRGVGEGLGLGDEEVKGVKEGVFSLFNGTRLIPLRDVTPPRASSSLWASQGRRSHQALRGRRRGREKEGETEEGKRECYNRKENHKKEIEQTQGK